MGLISEFVEVLLNGGNQIKYENLGYNIPKRKAKDGKHRVPRGTRIMVKPHDLSKGSMVKVEVSCDCCGTPNWTRWSHYLESVKEDGSYYCNKCALDMGLKEYKENKLLNGQSLEQWCIENNRQDVLDRWDYELNNCLPNEITYGTKKKYWFKCPNETHESELKIINIFTNGACGHMECNKCNSFAQWGIDNLGDDFLEKYWSNKNEISPWEIMRGTPKRVFIKCQEKEYHSDYSVPCANFTSGNNRCPYCRGLKVHPKDSLGQYLLDNFNEDFLTKIWSDKNKKSPFEYSPKSHSIVWLYCLEGKHVDYQRSINKSNPVDFRCPDCSFSKGEKRVEEYLISNNIEYKSQKIYKGLVGLGRGNLRYDFYLPKSNILIEYDGEYHHIAVYYTCETKEVSEERFRRYQIHDKLKNAYAEKHNIKLIRIPYWDFDNIETILNNELNINNT